MAGEDKENGVLGMTAAAPGPMLLNDVLQQRDQWSRDAWQLHNYPVAFVDTTLSSLTHVPTILTGGLLDTGVDSFVPESMETYHRGRYGYDAVASTIGLFAVAGAAARGARMGSAIQRMASSKGMNEVWQQRLFAQTERVAEVDAMMHSARMGMQTGMASIYGRTVPKLDMNQLAGPAFRAKGIVGPKGTYADVANWTSNLRTANALKEGLAQELAIAAMFNQSEFLFPDGFWDWNTFMFGGLGLGIGVGIEHAVGKAAMRKSMASAQVAGAQVAATRAGLQSSWSGGMLTERQAVKGVVGEQWQGVSANIYGLQHLDAAEQSVDRIVGSSQGALSREAVLSAITEARTATNAAGVSGVSSMFREQLNEPILRKASGGPTLSSARDAAGSETADVWRRLKTNPHAAVALGELTDRGVAANAAALRTTLEAQLHSQRTALAAAKKGGNAEAAAKTQGAVDRINAELKALDNYTFGVIEDTGVVNFNPNRAQPVWENPKFDSTVVSDRDGGVHLKHGGSGQSKRLNEITLMRNGELVRRENALMPGTRVDDASLTFEEMTAMHVGLNKAITTDAWKESFWANFLADPKVSLDDLPIAVLDAMVQGRLALPTNAPLPPKGLQVDEQLRNWRVRAMALAKKLDWWRANRTALDENGLIRELDLFDAEKALNVRLTDDKGSYNGLGAAFDFWAHSGGNKPATSYVTRDPLSVNTFMDGMYMSGTAFKQMDTRAMPVSFEDSYWKGMDGIGAHDPNKVGGVGAIYHKVNDPTDTEMQVAKMVAARNDQRAALLFDSESELVRNVASAATADPVAFAGAKDVNAIFGEVIGNNVVTQTTWKQRFQKTLQHAHGVGQRVQTAIDAHSAARLEPIARQVQELHRSGDWMRVAPQVSGAHHLISRGFALAEEGFVSGRNAIDIGRPGAKNTIKMLEDMHGGPLKGAPAEGEKWDLFDISIAANEGRYVPLELDTEAASLLNRYSDVSNEHFTAINALRKASGRPAMERLKGHLPVMNFNRYHLRYIQDPDTGKVVGYVKAKTSAEADREVTRALSDFNANRPKDATPFTDITQTQIKQYYDAVDEVFLHNLRDFSGIKQSGTSGGRNMDFRLDVSTDLVEDMMIAMRNTYTDLKNRSLAAVFSDALSAAEMARRKMGVDVSSRGKQVVHDPVAVWENLLMASDRMPADSLARRAHDWVEDLANDAMGKLGNSLPETWRVLDQLIHGRQEGEALGTAAQIKAAEKLRDSHKPFSHLVTNPEFAKYAKLGPDADPFRLARWLQMGNRAATSAFLKIANLPHAILNVAGVAVTLPAVIKQVQKMPGEDVAAWKSRVGHLADYFDPDTGVATVSSWKALHEGWHTLFNDTAAYEYAAARGMLGANMLEELNKLNAIVPSKFTEAMEGFAKYSDFLNIWLTPLQKKVTGKDPSAFTISERSETFMRAWAHMTGLALYKAGNKGRAFNEEAAHSFAHYFANQNIADFAPNVRGQAFRGTAGIPFGLFQSYSINALQRMFRYVEDRNHRAMLVQAATQTMMFGAGGLPGWNQLNALYFNKSDLEADSRGATSLNERVYAALGKDIADVLMTGSLSSLPKLAGADSGFNLYTSGDLNLRAPGIPPALSMITQMGEGVRQGIKVAGQELPKLLEDGVRFDPSRFAEVVANYAPSRGHRSLVDLVLGEKIDRNGNLIVEDTRSGVSLVARALGTRTSDELATSAALWENSQASAHRVAKMNDVRNQMLRHIRDGELTEQELVHYMTDYLLAGGREDQWARWLKFTEDKAGNTKAERALDRIVGKSKEVWPFAQAAVARLQNAGVVKPGEEPAAGLEPTEEYR